MGQSQVRPLSRLDILKRDYANGAMSTDYFERAVEALIKLGVADEGCPYSARAGWDWSAGLVHRLSI